MHNGHLWSIILLFAYKYMCSEYFGWHFIPKSSEECIAAGIFVLIFAVIFTGPRD